LQERPMSSYASPLSIGLMPERKNNWSPFVASFVVQAIGVVLLTQLGLIHPQKLLENRQFTLVPLTTVPLESYAERPQPRVVPPSSHRVHVPVVEAKLNTPRELLREIKPEVKRPEEIKPIPQEIARVQPKPEPAPQITKVHKPEVQTGMFASNAAPAVNRPAREVQTGGFGDPNGIKGQGTRNQHALIGSAGAFELPRGGGYGNGTGGTNGVRGTVVQTSFGDSGATAPVRTRGSIQQGGFGDARPVEEPKRAPKTAAAANTLPAEILSKPNPVYTDEARQMRLEGEVILQVRFGANGDLQVIRVVRGLGHGLDEAAVQAARKIKFKPAKQDGAAVDSIAALHVVFQLAY
jgi:TonB family protein